MWESDGEAGSEEQHQGEVVGGDASEAEPGWHRSISRGNSLHREPSELQAAAAAVRQPAGNNMSNRLDQSKSNLDPQWELKMLITEWKLFQGRKIMSHSSTRENSQVLYFTNCLYCICWSFPLEFDSFNKVIVWKQFHYVYKWNILIIWVLEHSLYSGFLKQEWLGVFLVTL